MKDENNDVSTLIVISGRNSKNTERTPNTIFNKNSEITYTPPICAKISYRFYLPDGAGNPNAVHTVGLLSEFDGLQIQTYPI